MKKSKAQSFGRHMRRFYWLYIFMVPGLLCMILFKFMPMYGLQIAFRDYSIVKGIWGSEWVGLKHFQNLFKSVNFLRVLKNSIVTSIFSLLWSFPAPIILALLLNEMKNITYKRTIQTIIYLPHFISWVIVITIVTGLLSQSNGIINNLIVTFGGEKIDFLTNPKWFRTVLIGTQIWKEAGWGTIVYMAALAGVDVQLYEAAMIDGANRWQRMLHITFPCIAGTVAIMLIMKMGHVLNNGFEQIWLLMNAPNKTVADVLETYSYQLGLRQGQYSFASAIGFFQSLVGMVMVFVSNFLSRRMGGKGLW
ncbi:MAG: sugar ABC transporter permease [Lachnospiraceae bacterium]|nr:sugar ABC transporter permease [Lachnospiraceae bacterium]MBR3824656.1 sugar ABC transporter permease [Lachnospiraceae bacterium]MBR4059404.1 sugar ABC transporter permease [Lachnospiraceae bacterium]MBR4084338.1 sugar ABC transporter permease [Lachnospiraceae bacterium]MBR6664367.1 sugar ABC transporter permease [Lachnospiraceae bacterium]